VSKVSPIMAVTAVLLVVHLGGCSLTSMTYLPEDYHPRQQPHCSGYIYPFIDALLAPMFNIMTITLTDYSSDEERQKNLEPSFRRITSIGVFVLATLATLASGAYGFTEANRCHRAEDSHRAWLKMRADREEPEEE
jgi:hypothetical protein